MDVVNKAGLKSPAIIIIGQVVTLRDTLRWFEDQPLFGKRVLVTRSREQASVLSEKLEGLSAEDRTRIYDVVDIMIKHSAQNEP